MVEGEGVTLPGASAAGAMTGLIGAWDRAEVVLNVRKAGVRRGSREGPAMADRVTLRGRKSRRAVRAEEDMTSDVSGVLIELAICGISVRESDLIHQRPATQLAPRPRFLSIASFCPRAGSNWILCHERPPTSQVTSSQTLAS